MTRRVVNVENLKEDPLRSHEVMLKANDQSWNENTYRRLYFDST